MAPNLQRTVERERLSPCVLRLLRVWVEQYSESGD
jgi:hypothetical protein